MFLGADFFALIHTRSTYKVSTIEFGYSGDSKWFYTNGAIGVIMGDCNRCISIYFEAGFAHRGSNCFRHVSESHLGNPRMHVDYTQTLPNTEMLEMVIFHDFRCI